MLRNTRSFEGYKVRAADDDVGIVHDFYFDDERWAIRYLVVDTGASFPGRRVLVSPISFRHADWSTREFHLALTVERVKNSPSVEAIPTCGASGTSSATTFRGPMVGSGASMTSSWTMRPGPFVIS